MENEKEQKTVTQTGEKTEVTVTQSENKTEVGTKEKTFTQTEVNAMLAKEKNKMPSKEELKAFNEWKESQKTEEQKKQEEIIKNQNLLNENAYKTQMLEIMKNGVNFEDAEFIQFKVSKMDGDFSENLTKFLTENPKYMEKETKSKVTTTGYTQNGLQPTISDEKAYMDKKYANNPYYKK